MENRSSPRVPLTASVKLFDWNRPLQADAGEISTQGIFLKTGEPLPEGRWVTMRLALPGLPRAFTILGKVVRTVRGGLLKPAGVGVRFLDLTWSARVGIQEYVQQRSA